MINYQLFCHIQIIIRTLRTKRLQQKRWPQLVVIANDAERKQIGQVRSLPYVLGASPC